MSTCQHGQNITHFCASQCCVWKDAGGCQTCMKKYHNHMGPTTFLKQSDINQLVKKYAVQHHIKPKCRSLQQAIFNYFRILYDMAIKVSQTDFLNQQSKIYYSEIQKASQSINQLDSFIRNFNKLAEPGNNAIQNDQTFFKKVHEIIKTILSNKPHKIVDTVPVKETLKKKEQQSPNKKQQKETKKIQQPIQNKETRQFKLKTEQNPRNLLNPKPVKQNLDDRAISIDKTFKKSKLQKIVKPQVEKQKQVNNGKGSFLTNQNQIKEQKQKLLELMKAKEVSSNEKLKLQQVQQTPSKKQTKKQKSVQSVTEEKSSNENSFDGDHKKNPDYAHTNIPRQKSHKKIFEDTEDVVKRTIIVAVNQNQNAHKNQTEIHSPLLKVKRMRASQLVNQNNSTIKEEIIPSPRSKSNSPNKQNIKDNEEKSLNLLVKSLGMKAQQAIPHLQSALRYADNNLSAAEYLSFLLLQIGRPKDCLNLCNKVLQKLQNSTEYDQLSINLNNNKTAALNMLGRYSQSIVILQKTLAYKQKDTLYKNLADSFFSIGIYEKAIYNYQKALEMYQNYDEAYYNLAVCLYTQENYYNAKMAVTRAIDISPKNNAYIQLLTHINERIQSI